MKIAIIGITGMGGRAIAELLLARGHQVTGIARNPQKHAARPGLTLAPASILQQKEISSVTRGHDCIVNAFSAGHDFSPRVYKDTIEGTRRTIRAAKDNSTPYLIHIGGAASLYVQPDMQVMDDPRFPVHYFRSMPPEHLAWLGEVTGMPQMQLLAAERRHELASPGIEPFQGPAWQGFEQFMRTATDFALLNDRARLSTSGSRRARRRDRCRSAEDGVTPPSRRSGAERGVANERGAGRQSCSVI